MSAVVSLSIAIEKNQGSTTSSHENQKGFAGTTLIGKFLSIDNLSTHYSHRTHNRDIFS